LKLSKRVEVAADEYLDKWQDDPEEFQVLVQAVAEASSQIENLAEKIGNDPKITSKQLDEIAALAQSFDESGEPFLQKQASVLDELLLTIAAPKSAIAQAKKAEEDEVNRLRDKYRKSRADECYEFPKESLDKQNQVKETAAAVDKVKRFAPLEAPLSTRYAPDYPGNMMTRINDHVYQDPMTGKIYDFKAGYRTNKGNEVPGTAVENQIPDLGTVQEGHTMFSTRESLMARYALNQKNHLVKTAEPSDFAEKVRQYTQSKESMGEDMFWNFGGGRDLKWWAEMDPAELEDAEPGDMALPDMMLKYLPGWKPEDVARLVRVLEGEEPGVEGMPEELPAGIEEMRGEEEATIEALKPKPLSFGSSIQDVKRALASGLDTMRRDNTMHGTRQRLLKRFASNNEVKKALAQPVVMDDLPFEESEAPAEQVAQTTPPEGFADMYALVERVAQKAPSIAQATLRVIKDRAQELGWAPEWVGMLNRAGTIPLDQAMEDVGSVIDDPTIDYTWETQQTGEEPIELAGPSDRNAQEIAAALRESGMEEEAAKLELFAGAEPGQMELLESVGSLESVLGAFGDIVKR
jgi:hypothetical protein